MIMKKQRNTSAAKWAEEKGYSVHKAFVYQHKLKQHVRFGCLEKEPIPSFLTCLDKPYYHFALYYRQDNEWLLWGVNGHFGPKTRLQNLQMNTLSLSIYWIRILQNSIICQPVQYNYYV